MELAVATNRPFAELAELPDDLLATYLDVLRKQNDDAKRG